MHIGRFGLTNWFLAIVVMAIAAFPARASSVIDPTTGPGENGSTPRIGLERGWIDDVLDLFVDIISILGGDAGALSGTPEIAMASFRAQYAALGVPDSLSGADQAELLGKVEMLDANLNVAPTNVSADEITRTRAVLHDIKENLHGGAARGQNP